MPANAAATKSKFNIMILLHQILVCLRMLLPPNPCMPANVGRFPNIKSIGFKSNPQKCLVQFRNRGPAGLVSKFCNSFCQLRLYHTIRFKAD